MEVDFKAKLIQRWNEIYEMPNVFRYKINIRKERVLPGEFGFLIQLNKERTTLRRPPQIIKTIVPDFNEEAFNFTRIHKNEILFDDVAITLDNNDTASITLLINNSPLTPYHSLMCPELKQKHPQILTNHSLRCSIALLTNINDRNFRIGYNSPGALASVNHLHMHLMYIDHRLYIENAPTHHLIGQLYQLDKNQPASGYCFQIIDRNQQYEICANVMKLISFFCTENIPHNVFITYGGGMSINNNGVVDHQSIEYGSTTMPIDLNGKINEILKIIVYPRRTLWEIKEFTTFNIAFCELSGYVPVGDENIYDSLTETVIMDKINKDIGELSAEIHWKILQLFS